jgi:TonB family protein
LRYPPEAAQKKIEGTVAVELTFNASGNIVDSRVLSGPEELRAAALESAVRGNYSINVARTLQVLVDFKLIPGVLAQAPPPPPPPPPPPGENRLDLIIDHFDIRGLSEPQLSDLRRRLDVFVGGPLGSAPIQQTIREAGLGFPYAIRSKKIDDGKISLDLAFGSEATVATPFGPTGVAGGTIMTPFGPVANPRLFLGYANGAADNSADSAPFVADLRPISTVNPAYPPLARQARIQGVVVMRALIDTEGKVENLRVLSGHPLMVQAAVEAVKQWVYPAQSSPVTTDVTVNFALSQ